MHFHIDPFTIRIELTPRRVAQVILLCDLAKEIFDTIQDVTITEWHSSLAILNLAFKPLPIQTGGVHRLEVILERMHGAIVD